MKKAGKLILFFSVFAVIATCSYKWYRNKDYYVSYLNDGRTISLRKDIPDRTQEDLEEMVEKINNGTYRLEEGPGYAKIHISGPTIGFSE